MENKFLNNFSEKGESAKEREMTGLHSKTVIWRKNLWNTTNCRYHLLMPPPRPLRKWVEAQKGNICYQHYLLFNPNWHEERYFFTPCPFWIRFCLLNIYQIFTPCSFLAQIVSSEFLSKIFTPCPFWIRFCLLNFYQKFPNFFGGENWHQLDWFHVCQAHWVL